MKRTSLLIMSFVMCVALCLTGCKKEESDTTDNGEKATLNDFVGTYDVVITEKPLIGENTSYNATLTIEKASAELLGIPVYESNSIAKFTYTSTNEELTQKDYFTALSSNNTYGYVKDGSMIVVSQTATTLEYTTQLAYKKTGSAATFNALAGTLPIEIQVTRR